MKTLKYFFSPMLTFMLCAQPLTTIFACQRTPSQELFDAAYNGNIAKMQELIPHVNVDIRDCNDTTPLMVAVKGGSCRAVETLIANGATIGLVDKEGKTALMVAIEQQNPDIIDVLIRSGAVVCKHCAGEMGLGLWHKNPILPNERSNTTMCCRTCTWVLCGVCGAIVAEWLLLLNLLSSK